MLGMNRTARQGQTVAFEYLRIYENEDKSLTLHASPSQQSSSSFALASIGQNEVVSSRTRSTTFRIELCID